MITETERKLSDYYEYQKQSNIFYEYRKLRKTYTIEYCDDENKLNRVGVLEKYGGLEINDAYHSITFEEDLDNTETFDGIVMEIYLHYLFNSKIYDVKLWEQIYDGKELLQERWIEFPSTFYHEIADRIAKDISESRDALQKQIEPLIKEVEEFNMFLKEMNAEKIYKEWKGARK